jgi:hypothetical protein
LTSITDSLTAQLLRNELTYTYAVLGEEIFLAFGSLYSLALTKPPTRDTWRFQQLVIW